MVHMPPGADSGSAPGGVLGSERGMVETEWWVCALMIPGHPGKQGQEALRCVLREHGQSGSFHSWGWGTAWAHPERRQGQGVVQWAGCCHLLSSDALGLVSVPCLPSFPESQLSSGSLPKIPSHIHLSFKQRSVSSLPEKMIPQPCCPGNLCVELHAFPL